ncbi:hypothetical protein P2G88_01705 [Aliiglaciecola sp. CAU 1673]|uniref:hypothetical protein n=1 Tax=Aliiglaciecola sp. CAU 1673 TaxID=3032595 RepID=UPI0023DB896E|nr:hypothetical protein [Aliiglaciecola sp. CAU 1673]MDF2176968.1 hypothetical protein [Aliiglaciecola sp. CAU 1673]
MMTEQGRVLERLLAGEFICEVSDEDGWRFLKQSANAETVNQYLSTLNRSLSSAADGQVFFAAYQSLGETERKALGSQFQEIAAGLMPLVEWLLLVQQSSGNDVPITQGSTLRSNELQTIIEDTPAFKEQLAKISRYRLFNSNSLEVVGQLNLVFKRLTELGYLIRPNPEKQIYIATGKVEYLYEVLRFIDETEALSLAEQAESAIQQGSLL